jgi:hypothetical protein
VNGKPSPGTLAIIIGAAVALIGSFLDIYEIGDESDSAWGSGWFPLLTLPALLCVLVAVLVCLTTFAKVKLPAAFLGISWRFIHIALGGWAAILMIGYLIGDPAAEFGGFAVDVDRAIGFWLMLLGSLAVATGAVIRSREPAAT